MKQIRKKTMHNGLEFDSIAECSCYKKLVGAFGEENVKKEPVSFLISMKDSYKTVVFRSYGKMLSDRRFPHDNSDRRFTPDFIVSFGKWEFIVEFKNAFTQSADYPLRRTIFLRGWDARNYEAYFEPKSQGEVNELIFKIQRWAERNS
jgi:hypothetical protein